MRCTLTALLACSALLHAAPAASAGLPEARHVLLGRSTEGRPIRATRIGEPDSPRKVLIVGAIHGNEAQGIRITRALRRRELHGADVWVVDTVNPDGLARHTRQNARGVDLNRNFSQGWRAGAGGGARPFSERESRVVRRWILRLRPAVAIWYHQPWDAVLAPCRGRHPVQRRYARRARMRVSCRGAGLPGTATSWQRRRVKGSTPFVVELAGGRVPAPAIRRHARAAQAAATGL